MITEGQTLLDRAFSRDDLEEHYDYFREADEWELSDDNPNHYKPTCIAEEPWWNEVKDREIKEWNIIGGGMYKVELWIDLEEE